MGNIENPYDTRDIVCFHNPDEPNGYLSNWYLSEFRVEGITYSSAEQYMMYQKAILFDDLTTAEKMMKTDDVAEIKALGRRVAFYNDEEWSAKRYQIVYRGVFEKFRQNGQLAEKLLQTGDAILAECAVKDTVWGIGLSMKDQRRFAITEWKGKNLLGKILMEVRSQIYNL